MDNNGLEIHKVECLRTKIEDQSKIAFEIEWSSDGKELYNVRIRMLIANKVNSLATISSIIGKHSVNIVNFHIITKSIDFYEAVMEIEVKGCSHLDKVLVSLSTTDVIYIVERL